MQTRIAAVLSLLFGVALIVPTSAQMKAVMPSDEWVGLFTTLCLQKFPDDSALATAAAEKGPAMTSAEVKSLLHDDPGQGWIVSGAQAKYFLTDEAPPYHSCALRRPTPAPINGNPFFDAAKQFVSANGGSLAPLQNRRVPGANGTSTLEVSAEVLDAKGQPTDESYIFIDVTNPAADKPDGTKSAPFFDVRFVRQIHHQGA